MKETQLSPFYINQIVAEALDEDAGKGDITSDVLIPADLQGRAYLLVKEEGIIAGTGVVERVFHQIDSTTRLSIQLEDGTPVKNGDVPILVSGCVRSILRAERVALNFFQRMCGIASMTARYVAQVNDLGVDIADTRKTTPTLRALEKYSVKMGGGRNHRMHLGDAVLIKDNHIIALRALGLSYRDIVNKARTNTPPGIKIESEASTIQEAMDAVEAGVDIVMLDNMTVTEMQRAVEIIAGRAEVEASGNVTLKNVREVALTGVDFISIGALTHSSKALDISLELEPQTFKLF
ncbi:MAG TPA: carboxylating nicotinate-nucleotide diphosphorylase [Dehalococcoidales bacterium]|nr:carboxylating nicotinate-nucleotide diphosphorylase [Dehalococcoidales bacterium]